MVSYLWDFGDGNTAEGALTTHTYDAEGDYTVTLTVTDAEGLTDTITLEVTVESVNEPTEELPLEVILAPNPTVDFVEVILNNSVPAEDIIGFTFMIRRVG